MGIKGYYRPWCVLCWYLLLFWNVIGQGRNVCNIAECENHVIEVVYHVSPCNGGRRSSTGSAVQLEVLSHVDVDARCARIEQRDAGRNCTQTNRPPTVHFATSWCPSLISGWGQNRTQLGHIHTLVWSFFLFFTHLCRLCWGTNFKQMADRA